jgi:two-component system, LuxR family, sensor kinase FixL
LFAKGSDGPPAGIGVGLSVSCTIVEAHGGELRAEAAAGDGTVCCFTVPRAAATQPD